MKKTFLFLTCLLATATLWADEPTASVASVKIYYCEPETIPLNITCTDTKYIWDGTEYTETGNYSKSYINRFGCDSIVNLALTFKDVSFTVSSSGDKIMFSPGNLQWRGNDDSGNALTHVYWERGYSKEMDGEGIYRFAEHQWDVIGETADNKNPNRNIQTWMDFFECGAVGDLQIKPYWTGNNTAYGGNMNEDLTKDWGFVNNIVNGDNVDIHGTWRVILKSEMDYLMNSRTNHDNLYGYGSINGVDGLILLPDSWEQPSTVAFVSGYSSNNTYYTQGQIGYATNNDWAIMEAAGAIFLPIAGEMYSGGSLQWKENGRYWTGTKYPSYSSSQYVVSFSKNMSYYDSGKYENWQNRLAIRLVKDIH